MFSDLCCHCCFGNSHKTMDKRKRLVPYSNSESDDESSKKKNLKKEERKRLVPYSDSESDDESPKKKYLKKEERKRFVPYSDSESDDGSPKKKYLKKEESDSEDDFLPKKKTCANDRRKCQ